MSVDLSTTTASSLANRSLPGGCSFCEVTLARAGANRLDSSRRPTCCTTQPRPTNTRLLRKSLVWPNTRPQVLERFVRHLQYAAGIGWLQANTFGCSSATISHVSLLGLFASATSVQGELRFPNNAYDAATGHLRTPTGHLRTRTEPSDSTGPFGFHRNLRVPPDLRVHLRSLGISTGCLSPA